MRVKKILLMTMVFAMILSCMGIVAFAEETLETNITISDLDGLKAFRDAVNNGDTYSGKTVTLTANVDLSGETDWTPIGNGSRNGSGYTGNAFKGVFDGGNNEISNLKIISGTDSAAIGLFGVLDGGTVKNLVLKDVNVNATGNENAGGVIGLMVNGAVADKITVSGSVSAVDGVGGIAGRMTISGTVSNCVNSANVNGAAVGGIVGKAYYTGTGVEMNIYGCSNSGKITTTGNGGAGGIVGFSTANVSDCGNTGEITSNGKFSTSIGGIVGWQQMYGEIKGNVNSGSVTSEYEITTAGGIVGWVNYQYATDGTASAYPRCEIVSVCGNTNNTSVIASNTSLGSGGIVGGTYNAVSVCNNKNYAEKISGGVFAAGVLGNYQLQTDNGYYANKSVTITENITTTTEDNINATCKDIICYDNVNVNFDYSSLNNVVNPFKDDVLVIAGMDDETVDGVVYHPVYVVTSVDSLDYQKVGFDFSFNIFDSESGNITFTAPYTTETSLVFSSVSDGEQSYNVESIGGKGKHLFMSKLYFHKDYYHNNNTKIGITPFAYDKTGKKIVGWTVDVTNDYYKTTLNSGKDLFKEEN